MATVASGASVTITLQPGQTAEFAQGGAGQVVYGPGYLAGQPVSVGTTPVAIGPFSASQILYASSTGGALNYTVFAPSPSKYIDPRLVASAGNGRSLSIGGAAGITNLSPLRSEALVRLIGTASNGGAIFNQSTGLSASALTICQRQEMETGFTAARLMLVNRANVAMNANKALIGVTETASVSTSANMGAPVIGGVAYQAVASAGSLNGWRSVTWGGAATSNIASAAAAQTFSLSDWIPIQDIARADGGSRPLLLWSTYHDGATQGNFSFNVYTQTGADAPVVPLPAMRGRVYSAATNFGDAVADPTRTMALANTIIPCAPIVRFKRPVLSVWGIGDSTMQNNAQAPEGLSAWGMRACAEVSTESTPVVWANLGASSRNFSEFWPVVEAYLAAGVPAPSVFVVEAASVNDVGVSVTVRTKEDQLQQASRVLSVAAQYGVPYVIFVPLMPYNSLDATKDAIRKSTNQTIMQIAEDYGCQALILDDLGDSGAPQRWVPAYTGDGLHPNPTAFDAVLAPALSAALLRIMVN